MEQNKAARKLTPRALELARNLKAFTQEEGITQQAVADKIGRPQGYVGHRLNGRSAMDIETLGAIADFAGMSVAALLVEMQARSRS